MRISKQSVITALRVTGTRDPDILDRKRLALRSAARASGIAGGVHNIIQVAGEYDVGTLGIELVPWRLCGSSGASDKSDKGAFTFLKTIVNFSQCFCQGGIIHLHSMQVKLGF